MVMPNVSVIVFDPNPLTICRLSNTSLKLSILTASIDRALILGRNIVPVSTVIQQNISKKQRHGLNPEKTAIASHGEVLPLTNYLRSDDEHQDRLTRIK